MRAEKEKSIVNALTILETNRITVEAIKIFDRMIEYNPDRSCCYLTIADGLTGTPALVQFLGVTRDLEKARKHLIDSREKAARLSSNLNHVSSWQSRDVKNLKFGGAIRTSKGIISLSGFLEHWDEAFCMVLAEHMRAEFDASRIVKISTNVEYEKLRSKFFAGKGEAVGSL